MRRIHTKRAGTQGFTLIEVMVAVAIMTVGGVGIMALQQATSRGNGTAREFSTATQITRTWLERVRRESVSWSSRSNPAGMPAFEYLNAAPPTAPELGPWFTPYSTTPGVFAWFNYHGEDTDVTGFPANEFPRYFCTNVRLRWVVFQEAMRVDVRTWWHKSGSSSDRSILNDCAEGDEAGVTTELDNTPTRLHAVYGSTVIRYLATAQ